MSKVKYQKYFHPGKKLSDEELRPLVDDLRSLSEVCLGEAPYYQALTGRREDLEKVLLMTARINGKLVGFCSALHLKVPGAGNVIHTGLTCVDPSARGMGLTHKLVGKLIKGFLVRSSPFANLWITNCACVVSSLGNIALYFEDVYPSPKGPKQASKKHKLIADYINKNCRELIAINDDAVFNPETFVFEGSVDGTCFQKEQNDPKYNHRDPKITDYYTKLMNFERGDEVLQIGWVNISKAPIYSVRKRVIKQLNKLKNKRRLKRGV